jgi:hypothetical protein
MQVRQTRCPSRGLSMRTTLWQPGQDGRTISVTPASCSRSISRRIARVGCEVAVPGQQGGVGFQDPGEFLLVGGAGCRPADRIGDHFLPGLRVQFGDQGTDHREGVASVGFRALVASWSPGSVA